MTKAIATTLAPAALGPYSQGIDTGDLIFTSGQIPLDPDSGRLETDIVKAATRCLDNIKAVLAAAGVSMAEVIKVTVYLKDMADFQAMNEVYATYFQAPSPARSCIQVAGLPLDARLEMEAIAQKA